MNEYEKKAWMKLMAYLVAKIAILLVIQFLVRKAMEKTIDKQFGLADYMEAAGGDQKKAFLAYLAEEGKKQRDKASGQ